MLWNVFEWTFAVMEAISFGMCFFYVATHKVDICWQEFIRWVVAVIASGVGFLVSYCMVNEKWADVPVFMVWALVIVCIGYFVFRWVMFFVDRKKEKGKREIKNEKAEN